MHPQGICSCRTFLHREFPREGGGADHFKATPPPLIHVFSATTGIATAGNFNILNGEFVIVGHFFTGNYAPISKNDDMFLAPNFHNFGVTVGLEDENEQ